MSQVGLQYSKLPVQAPNYPAIDIVAACEKSCCDAAFRRVEWDARLVSRNLRVSQLSKLRFLFARSGRN